MARLENNASLEDITFNEAGLVPAIARQYDDGIILMMAWMNLASLKRSLETGRVWYYSRSRQKLWCKGESSGNHQRLLSVNLDCDGDTLLLEVDQEGPACHMGERSCFFRKLWDKAENL